MKTAISTDREAAVELLRRGEVVALPTETVYGLAGEALRIGAVAKIFEAKERPRIDPLIVHLPDHDWLQRVTEVNTEDKNIVDALTARFWPGPFTLILPKRDLVPDLVTAGLSTVAVRMSAHPVFSEIIRELDQPLAAPSANRFGRISPTRAEHVRDELEGCIPLIIDGGPTEYGIESTIVAVCGGEIEVLRRGPITDEMLREMGFRVTGEHRLKRSATTAGATVGKEEHRLEADATAAGVTADEATEAESGIGFQPMDPDSEILIREGANLPHWSQTDATYAVTFRLIDSLPQNVLARWKSERSAALAAARARDGRPDEEKEKERATSFSEKIERYLDSGHGQCWLAQENVARVIRDSLQRFAGERYDLLAWCVMPNHVHVVVAPKAGNSLSQILHSWKTFTSREANRLLHRHGAFWQKESYDHLIRDADDLRNQIRYVLSNPEKAGLRSWPWKGEGRRLESAVISEKEEHRLEADATLKTGLRAPGQLASHYAPRKPLYLTNDPNGFKVAGQRIGVLAWNDVRLTDDFAVVRRLSEGQDLREAAANLFRLLRELDDDERVDVILAERVPEHGLGSAIMDRLRRAAHHSV